MTLTTTIPKEAVATPEQVRDNLALTDEQRKELQDEQLKTFRSRARLTPEEMKMGRAIELERHHRQTGNVNALAEALADQGRFREAAEMATRKDLKAVLLEKAEAVDRPDADCECDSHIIDGDFKIPVQYVESYVMRDGKLMPAIRCRTCKCLNVMPILPHLADQQAAQATREGDREVKDFFRK